MSLALVTLQPSDFDLIYYHLLSYKPPYRNMHLREACQRNNKRDLRYLHGMYAKPGASREIEGMISGPGVLWHYKLIGTKWRTQLNVLLEQGTPKALARIRTRFLSEIMTRIDEEQSGSLYFPSRTPGQFYLRRRIPGIAVSHRTCARAVAAGVLDRRFVSQLAQWNFELLCP
jgi:hypothetical protein